MAQLFPELAQFDFGTELQEPGASRAELEQSSLRKDEELQKGPWAPHAQAVRGVAWVQVRPEGVGNIDLLTRGDDFLPHVLVAQSDLLPSRTRLAGTAGHSRLLLFRCSWVRSLPVSAPKEGRCQGHLLSDPRIIVLGLQRVEACPRWSEGCMQQKLRIACSCAWHARGARGARATGRGGHGRHNLSCRARAVDVIYKGGRGCCGQKGGVDVAAASLITARQKQRDANRSPCEERTGEPTSPHLNLPIPSFEASGCAAAPMPNIPTPCPFSLLSLEPKAAPGPGKKVAKHRD